MNSKQLTVFHEVMRCGSFSEAARNLNRTQPAISAMVANLEQELGYKLFIRRAGQLLPVPEAHYLFAETQDIMDRMRTVEMNMKRVGELEQGQLRMVSMPGPSVVLIPRLMARFASTRAGLNIALLTRSSAQVRHLIATQQFDVGLADWSDEDIPDNGLLTHDRVTLNCVCALPAYDPLAARPVITPQALHGRDLAALFPGHVTYRMTSQAFAQAGVAFKPRFETQYFYPLLSFVEAGLACAIIDRLSSESYRLANPQSEKVVFRPFAPDVPFSVTIITPMHRPSSRISQAFAATLKTELQRYSAAKEP